MLYIVPIAWLYVVVLMAVAEATSAQGTWLGAVITFVLYGLLPLGIVMYVLLSPARRKAARRKQQADERAADASASSGDAPDGGGQAP